MAKGNNSLLTALALVETVKPQLRFDKREQIPRASLEVINRALTQALSKINQAEISDTYIVGYLISVVEFIDILLEQTDYTETDTETKDIITDKVLSCLDNLYLEVGKYYTDRDFDHNIRMEPLLMRVVDNCINRGYYFGETVS